MAVSVTFQSQFTWAKLGYLYFSDSLAYKEVLEQNPQWKVVELPPIGAQLEITGAANVGGGTPGGLTQGSFLAGTQTLDSADDIFPFNTEDEYDEALDRYTIQGVLNRESLNGITFDSAQAFTGVQSL